MISVEEALAHVLAPLAPVPVEHVSIAEAVGQIGGMAPPKSIDSKTHEALVAENASLKAQIASSKSRALAAANKRRRAE